MNREIANKSNPPVRIKYMGTSTFHTIDSILLTPDDPITVRYYAFRFNLFPTIEGRLALEEPILDEAEIKDAHFSFYTKGCNCLARLLDQTIPRNFVDVLPQIVLKQDGYESTVFDFVWRLAFGARSFVPTK